MQCPESPVYNTSVEQKRHAQSVARQQRLGTPKLRDLLREKCRIRIINARKHSADGNRQVQLSELNEILRHELKDMDKDLELEAHIFEELLADINEWYALQEQHVETLYTESCEAEPLLCPVCLIQPLQRLKAKALYTCACGIQFDLAAEQEQLKQLLQLRVNEHELKCTQALGFFIETLPASKRLFAICGCCDYLCSV
ncbi:Ripalpha [Drosophila busckii]|uniref:Ripalpha n=1 Tax=Drosophila busckii TaxID=30019 RepID=A0A0M4ER47_DROBS|nr:Ripalpha [Drosophila busckii]